LALEDVLPHAAANSAPATRPAVKKSFDCI
jgi:hypothetical protein